MKCLIIGGNRFVGLRLSLELEKIPGCEIHILNRTGQAPHCKSATVYKGDRISIAQTHVDSDYDTIFDFACYNEAHAESALNFFKKVKHYIFISTMSVYNYGAELKESDFDPKHYERMPATQAPASPGEKYQFEKRQAEAVFAQQASFPVLSVRFPCIVGPDDYTERLEFHIRHIRQRTPLYLPNPQARISLIHAQDATDFLIWAAEQRPSGPLNVASTKALALKDLIGQIELATGGKAILVPECSDENASPYGVKDDYFMDMARLNKLGFTARPIDRWLPELLGASEAPRGSFVH